MKAGELSVLFFRMSRDFDDAHEILKWRTVASHIFQIARFFSRFIGDRTTIYPKFLKKCSPELCWVSTAQFMTAVHVEWLVKTKGNFRVPSAKDDAHRRWRDEWLGEIKKTREMDQDFRRHINDDKIFTCEKHFDPEEIEIFKYRVMNSFTIRIERSISCQSRNTRGRKDRKRSWMHVTDEKLPCWKKPKTKLTMPKLN